MKKILLLISFSYLIFSCASFSEKEEESKKNDINYSKSRCYEVLIKKTDEDSLTYDKPLNWDLVNFTVRNDEYSSLGTAFTINERELVTAAHVMYLFDESLTNPKRYIREKIRNGNETIENIYEVDQIRAFNNHKDYVVFTVKDKVFDKWFDLEENFQLDSKVYTVGDAFGEGIITREGILLDVIPENENGEWNYLKSSIATNPGNSGGPLLNEEMNVIGVVLSKKDDFCYSLPISEISNEGTIHNKYKYGFLTINDKHLATFDYSIEIPKNYRDFMKDYSNAYNKFYLENMNLLFDKNSENLFPYGESSLNALYGANTSRYPQIFYEDNDNKQWSISNYKYEHTDIGENGYISSSAFYKDSNEWFINISKPDDISLEELYKSPKIQMDLILKGNNITRKLTENDQGSRILSYGDPRQVLHHTDSYGRKWNINIWYLEYSDVAVINLTTPNPKGLATIYSTCYTYSIENALVDLKKITDFVNISYYGDLKQWAEFLQLKEYLFEPISEYSISFLENDSIEFTTDSFDLNSKPLFFNVNEKNTIGLYFDIYPDSGEYKWGIRKFILDSDSGSDNYLLFYRWNKPVEGLKKGFQEDWDKNIMNREHPYNSVAYTDEGVTKIGTIYNDQNLLMKQDPYAYSLIVAREGTIANEEISENLNNYFSSIKFY
ncbi:MAG: trypsin-like peptidase domain-containing protein [Spirochaetaceae bacterium]|nr:trypsin-like peptidase domain-containing protein [Spirochaetaceae bacterium]